MKTFNEYYTITESPQLTDDIGTSIPDSPIGNKQLATKFMKNGKVVTQFNFRGIMVYVFEIRHSSGSLSHGAIHNGELLAAFDCDPKFGGIQFSGVWNSKSMKGLARYIMLNFYLQTYRFIQSSDIHTPRGARYWKKLIQSVPIERVVVINDAAGTEEPVTDVDKLWGHESTAGHKLIRIYA